jgi:hypothetical protein
MGRIGWFRVDPLRNIFINGMKRVGDRGSPWRTPLFWSFSFLARSGGGKFPRSQSWSMEGAPDRWVFFSVVQTGSNLHASNIRVGALARSVPELPKRLHKWPESVFRAAWTSQSARPEVLASQHSYFSLFTPLQVSVVEHWIEDDVHKRLAAFSRAGTVLEWLQQLVWGPLPTCVSVVHDWGAFLVASLEPEQHFQLLGTGGDYGAGTPSSCVRRVVAQLSG